MRVAAATPSFPPQGCLVLLLLFVVRAVRDRGKAVASFFLLGGVRPAATWGEHGCLSGWIRTMNERRDGNNERIEEERGGRATEDNKPKKGWHVKNETSKQNNTSLNLNMLLVKIVNARKKREPAGRDSTLLVAVQDMKIKNTPRTLARGPTDG